MKLLNKNKQEGFTLLEVLVAILVFSFGLLGVAGMLTLSVRNNHNGYLRSQANFLAENMVDRMTSNPVALWNDSYSGIVTAGSQLCGVGDECDFDELAAFDKQQWNQSLTALLPNAQGEIDCQTNSVRGPQITARPPSIWEPVAPYNGICTITVTWSESNKVGGTEDEQTLVLVTQP